MGDTWPYVAEPSFDLGELAGLPVDEAVRRIEAEVPFYPQVVDLDRHSFVTADLAINRIRVFHRGGVVDHAHRG